MTRQITPQVRMLAAGCVLVGGAAWAGVVYSSQPKYLGPDTRHIRALAERVENTGFATRPLGDVVSQGPGASPVIAAAPAKPAATPKPGGVKAAAPVESTPVPAPKPAEAPAKPAAPAPPADPVKNIALMGVTTENNREVAWLVNLENQERDLASIGDEGFGFTVKDIDDETVTLARGGEEYTVRLGAKTIPTNDAPVLASGSMPGFGGEGRGNRGGDGGSREDRRARFQQMMAQNGGSGRSWGGSRGNWGGGSRGNWGGSSQAVVSGSGSNSGNWGNRGGSSNRSSSFSSNRGGFSSSRGGFGGGGFSGGGNWGGNRGGQSNSQFAAGAAGSTSNPQTARRRGGSLIGGATPLEAPSAIMNPQTQRRLGTTSGPAFGQTNGNSGGRGMTGQQGSGRGQRG